MARMVAGRSSSLRRTSRSRKKKNRNPNKKADSVATEPQGRVPRSMVFARGSIGRTLRRLEQDLRRVMMPHTSTRLRESKRNSLKDFLQVAGPLGVSHFLVLSASTLAPYLRVARTPRGPTLTFKICQYSLAADVANSQSKPRVPPGVFEKPPLLVMHGFGASKGPAPKSGQSQQQQHLKLMSILWQNMFPSIDVSTVKLSECSRVLLFSHDPETGLIEMRHYHILAKPLGISRPIRKLVETHKVPDLSAFADVSEFIMRGGYGSESEAEDESAHVRLPQSLGRGNRATQQSAVQLHELGPRLSLQLVKVEEGLLGGQVMFHRFVKKTAEEVAKQQAARKEKEGLREQRRLKQEQNVLRKKDVARKRGSQGSAGRLENGLGGDGGEGEEAGSEEENDDVEEDDVSDEEEDVES